MSSHNTHQHIDTDALLQRINDAKTTAELPNLSNLLAIHHGDAAILSDAEQDAMFQAAWQPNARTPQQPRTISSSRWIIWTSFAVAVVALALLSPVIYRALNTTPTGHRIKSASTAPQIELQPYLGQHTIDGPKVTRALNPHDTIAQDEHILFRYTLAAPAWLALMSTQTDRPPQLLWQSDTKQQGGSFEIESTGQALSLPGDHHKGPFTLIMIASHDPLHDLTSLKTVNVATLKRQCPSCTIKTFPLQGAP